MKCINGAYWLIALLLLAGCDAEQASIQANAPKSVTSDLAAMTPLQRAKAGKALWEEKCRSVAGEKIYKVVPDVEGLVLLKVRPKAGVQEWADPNWPGAAFAKEAQRDEYVNTFLGYEYATFTLGRDEPNKITKEQRGYIATDSRPGLMDRPGYSYIDVVDPGDGKRYRYTGSIKVVGRKDTEAEGVQMALARNPDYDLNIYRWALDRNPAPDLSPLYGVTFEDHVIPSERALGVASSTVRVINLKTGDVLGEMLRYVWSTPASRANPSPWLTAYKCPGHAVGAEAATRKFVDQILIPRKEK
ncbi:MULTISPECIES: hypothetical protein [unclassified Pseudomonas]|uniref:hypothetical protein n=1 Tax=unclassified Pseudomonas TaxID=196821 RepID=UPI002449DA58|nr:MULTISPECIES: hypothetical protein [unclassified Pseudomonas]MDG9928934.1 hypothetical protein [Pseudomonas sp. GD04042]MDH0483897.1 hypothetical protein [Pseudomonas sp. GD04015]MDH0604260.1 hypothetical protein [Pseudomonas sp. GD03869]